MKKKLIPILKILFSATLIFLLFKYKVDIHAVLKSYKNVRVGWLLAGASLHLTGLFFSAVRWKLLLEAQDIKIPVYRLFLYYLVGHFFNMFLPSRVGGDVVRIIDTTRDHGSTAKPLTVVLVERISGMLIMLLFAACVLILNIDIGFDYRSRIPGINIGVALFIAAVFCFPFLFHPRIEKLIFQRVFKLPIPEKIKAFISKIYKAFQVYGGKRKYLIAALFAGALLQLNYFFHYYFLARSLGIMIPLSFFFVMTPIRTIALMIPFFINGIGLREFFDVQAFGLVGISEHSAVAFAELAWLIQIAFAVVGGVIYAVRRRAPGNTSTEGTPE